MGVITISRQYGAGGKTLGSMIAKKLGYAFVDEDILQIVAEKANVSKRWVQNVHKEAGGKLQNFISTLIPKSYIERIIGGAKGYIDEEVYVNILHDVIRQLAEEDNVVILGRGAQYVLKDKPKTLHVLLVAELKDRFLFMEKHYRLNPSEAIRVVDIQDKRRTAFYRKFGQLDYDQPCLYNMVINMSKFDLDKACNYITKTANNVFRA